MNKSLVMERKIGEIFEYNGEWYQCVEQIGCDGCAFDTICDEIDDIIGNCISSLRHDDKSVVFKKLEKVGEPYPKFIFGRGNIKVQRYKLYRPTNTNICNGIWIYHWNEKLVDIEIKQNKEDMEEKKVKISREDALYLIDKLQYILDDRLHGEGSDVVINEFKELLDMEEKKLNLKPFSLEAAKSGKPVCTRDGRKARIICFDMNANSPIVALVDYNGQEVVVCCHNNGRNYHAKTTYNDLMMLSERKEGWVNVYKETSGEYYMDKIIHKTEKFALDMACPDNYIGTVKIEWYE